MLNWGYQKMSKESWNKLNEAGGIKVSGTFSKSSESLNKRDWTNIEEPTGIFEFYTLVLSVIEGTTFPTFPSNTTLNFELWF